MGPSGFKGSGLVTGIFVNTGNPGFPEPWLSEIRSKTTKKSGDNFDLFSFVSGFSSRGFWKIIPAGLPHCFGQV